MKRDVIIALDFKDGETALNFLDKFQEEKPFVKVGMELFFAEGPSIVKEIKRRGHKIFLDLKLHDIPNTVKGGMRSLTNLGADILNVHAAGTIEMMKAALEGTQRPGRHSTYAYRRYTAYINKRGENAEGSSHQCHNQRYNFALRKKCQRGRPCRCSLFPA